MSRTPRPYRAYRMVVRRVAGRWAWECGLCHPLTRGGTGSWEHTLRNVRRHFRVRQYHHAWTVANRVWGPPSPARRVANTDSP